MDLFFNLVEDLDYPHYFTNIEHSNTYSLIYDSHGDDVLYSFEFIIMFEYILIEYINMFYV